MDMLPEPSIPVNAPAGQSPHALTSGGNNAFHNFANDYSHISDPNLRRRLALSDIDRVPFGLYHVRAVLVAGTGFFLDSYSIFAINLITTFLGLVFWSSPTSPGATGEGHEGTLPGPVNTALKSSTSAGIVIGQVVFGWLADVFGRRRMYGIELGVIVVSTLGCALAGQSVGLGGGSTGVLVFWRVMMGVGIGGDYPLSSVITSEFAPTRWRGAMMAAVFSMQGIGQLLSAVVALVVTVAFKESFLPITDPSKCDLPCQMAADRAWRIIVGFGALPACFALYYRITIPETPRYTFDVAQDVEKADADIKAYVASRPEGVVDPVRQAKMLLKGQQSGSSTRLTIPSASWGDVFAYFRQPRNLRILIGTTFSWFFLDLAFYGLGLNNTIVLSSIGYSHGPTLYHTLYNNAVGMIILACAGSLPGYWTSILTIDTLGRKPIQTTSFIILTILFLILGFGGSSISNPSSLLALYIIAQFFFNWGPNTTTFIIPGECFPTRYRSTGHGISAAMGKVGAILAQVISIPLLSNDTTKCENETATATAGTSAGKECSLHQHPWLDRLMQIFALFMFLGMLVSLLVPETKGITLEELAGEGSLTRSPSTFRSGMSPAFPPGGGGSTNGNGGGKLPTEKGGYKKWWNSEWNPFKIGGQPAGFFYNRQGGGGNQSWPGNHGYGNSGRSPRVGIMTSPEIAAQHQQQQEKKHGAGRAVQTVGRMMGLTSPGSYFAQDQTSGPGSTSTSKNKHRSRSKVQADQHGIDDDDEVPMTPGTASMGMGVLPGWGAGWGRVDLSKHQRGPSGSGSGGSMDNTIRLQDVGSLLK
ncbi:Major facilitator superfamily domain containing protein [Rhypophila sp. PSN 637]